MSDRNRAHIGAARRFGRALYGGEVQMAEGRTPSREGSKSEWTVFRRRRMTYAMDFRGDDDWELAP